MAGCMEDSKLNNRTDFNDDNYLEETPIILDGAIAPSANAPALPDSLDEDGNIIIRHKDYFDPATGLLNNNFQEIDLDVIKDNPAGDFNLPAVDGYPSSEGSDNPTD